MRLTDHITVLFGGAVNRKLDELLKGQQKLMANVLVDSDKITAVAAAIDTLTTQSKTALQDIADEITALKNSGTVDPSASATLDSVLAKIGALSTSIEAADPGAISPAPAPSVP